MEGKAKDIDKHFYADLTSGYVPVTNNCINTMLHVKCLKSLTLLLFFLRTGGINLSPTMIALPLLSSLNFVLDLIFGVYGCINHLEGDSTLVEELEL